MIILDLSQFPTTKKKKQKLTRVSAVKLSSSERRYTHPILLRVKFLIVIEIHLGSTFFEKQTQKDFFIMRAKNWRESTDRLFCRFALDKKIFFHDHWILVFFAPLKIIRKDGN